MGCQIRMFHMKVLLVTANATCSMCTPSEERPIK